MNDPVAARLIRIEDEMYYANMDRAAATALVDAQIAEENAFYEAYLGLVKAAARLRARAA